MTNLDDKILQAISAENEQSLQNYSKELGIFGLIRESFKGTHKWIVVLAVLLILIFAGITIYCAIHFIHADDLATKLNWMAGGFLSFVVFAMLRLWYFMELNRLSVTREIKRVELQVSLLIKKLGVLDKG